MVAVNRTIVERQRNSVVPRHNRAGKLQPEAATCAFVGEAKLLARPVADSEFQVGPPYCLLAIRGPDSGADTAELRCSEKQLWLGFTVRLGVSAT